jgi:hypothetical protein
MVVGRGRDGGSPGAGEGQPVFASVDQMLAGATDRTAAAKTSDSLSGSPFERVVIDGKSYLVKYVGQRVDWLARALDDRYCFVRQLWTHGVLAALPAEIDHTIEAVADDGPNERVALLLRDVGPWLVPSGSDTILMDQHRAFMEHMAALHAAFWGFDDRVGLLPPRRRYTALGPATTEREAAAGHNDPVPKMLAPGWAALRHLAPETHDHAVSLSRDPTPLVTALERTPATLVHGDWKAGNLGSHPDGRTILLDWAGRESPRPWSTSRGISRSTATGSQSPRRTRSTPIERRCGVRESIRIRGGTTSSARRCSERSCNSDGPKPRTRSSWTGGSVA